MATIEEIRSERVRLNGQIYDMVCRKAMFGDEPEHEGKLAAYQAELLKLRTEICQHEVRIGVLCPDCGELLVTNPSPSDGIKFIDLYLDDAGKWLQAQMEQS